MAPLRPWVGDEAKSATLAHKLSCTRKSNTANECLEARNKRFKMVILFARLTLATSRVWRRCATQRVDLHKDVTRDASSVRTWPQCSLSCTRRSVPHRCGPSHRLSNTGGVLLTDSPTQVWSSSPTHQHRCGPPHRLSNTGGVLLTDSPTQVWSSSPTLLQDGNMGTALFPCRSGPHTQTRDVQLRRETL